MGQSAVTGGDLFADLADAAAGEQFDDLLARPGVRILRIVSNGQASPDGEWYDQDSDEWVAVLRGRAGVLIEGEAEARELGPGEYLFLPAHSRHRVAWTSPDEATVWLAVYIDPPAEQD